MKKEQQSIISGKGLGLGAQGSFAVVRRELKTGLQGFLEGSIQKLLFGSIPLFPRSIDKDSFSWVYLIHS